MSDSTPAGVTATPATPTPRRRGRLRGVGSGLAWLLTWWPGALLALLVSLALLIAGWAQTAGSLDQALRWAAAWTAQRPAERGTLEVQLGPQAGGNRLIDGGQIERLRWSHNGLSVDARGVRLQWTSAVWLGLVRGQGLRLRQLRIDALDIVDQRPSVPTTPLTQFTLPLQLDLPLDLGALNYQGSVTVSTGALSGRYRYDTRQQHDLQIDTLQVAQGRYSARLQLGGTAPMAVEASLQGNVSLPAHQLLRGLVAHPLLAQGTLRGTLAGPEARLQLRASLQPVSSTPAEQVQRLPEADLQATLRPWADQPVDSAELKLERVDLATLWPGAPRTALSGQASARPSAAGWSAELALNNRQSGPWDQQRLPLEQLRAKLQQQGPRWQLNELQAVAGQGSLQGEGELMPPAQAGTNWQATGTLRWRQLNPAALHSALPTQRLDLSAQAGSDSAQATSLRLRAQPSAGASADKHPLALQAADLTLRQNGDTWTLDQAQLQLPQARLQAQGQWNSAQRSGSSQGDWQVPGASGRWQGQLAARSGEASTELQVQQAERLLPWLRQISQRLAPDTPWPADLALRGQGRLRLGWQGGWTGGQQAWAAWSNPKTTAWQRAQGLAALPLDLQLELPQLDVLAQGKTLQLSGWDAQLHPQAGGWRLSQKGRIGWQGHRIQIDSGWSARPEAGGLSLTADPLTLQAQLAGTPARLANWQLQPGAPLVLRLGDDGLELAAGRLRLGAAAMGTEGLELRWDTSRWRANGPLVTRGELRGLPLSWIDTLTHSDQAPEGLLADAGLEGDLLLDGRWDLDLPAQGTAGARGQITLERRSGDLALRAGGPAGNVEPLAAGLKTAALTLGIAGAQVQASLRWDSALAGQIDASASSSWQGGMVGPQWPADAPLQGRLRAALPQVGLWSALAPPGWRMSGTAQADAELSGTRAAPRWSGQLAGQRLALRSVVDGIEFVNGELRASLQGDRLAIERFSIEGPGGAASGGSLRATGSARWQRPGAGPDQPAKAEISLQTQVERLRVSARADRRLTVSGAVEAQLSGARLQLRGNLKADQASFVLPDENTPSLGADVVVRRRSDPPRSGGNGQRVEPDIQLTLDLGESFDVRGHGLEARLEGQLQLISTPRQPTPRVLGEVRTSRGTYRAYGQRLDIEQGVLRFVGPYDNPALDVLAIRPFTTQRVGVQIRGTAQAPQVRLYAEPDLPDSEKLAWLVLGRSAAGGGAEAALLQQAAVALLSGGSGGNPLGQLFGLDEVSVRGSGTTTTNASGETVSGATFTLGKRVSSRLYVAYERSLAGTLGTFSLFYDVSRRLTLRARTGEDNAVDLIFTLPYD